MRLKKLVLNTTLGLMAAAMLCPAVLSGCSKSDEKDPVQTNGTDSTDGTKTDNKKDSESDSKDQQEKEESLSDTVRWFNASYAILTELNGCDYNIFAGLKPNFSVAAAEQKMLEDSWGVTDRASADETIDWILTEGHRYGFTDNMSYLAECGLSEIEEGSRKDFILENFDISDEEADFYVTFFAMYGQYGAEAIDAWDYCRALNLMGFFYLAGYYTETEALDGSLEIAKTLQGKFDSWDALVESYLRGYEYWAEESSDERREIYEDLKKRDDNPYSVDYNTELVKSW